MLRSLSKKAQNKIHVSPLKRKIFKNFLSEGQKTSVPFLLFLKGFYSADQEERG